MKSPDIRIDKEHVSPPESLQEQSAGAPLVHFNSAPLLTSNNGLLSPTITQGSLKIKNRKPPPKALDDAHSANVAFHGLNKRDHALPTPFPFPSPRFGRFRSRDGTPAESRAGTPPRDGEEENLHHRRSSRQMFVKAIDHALDTVVESLSMRQRLKHFTWTWFTMTMATGQLANIIYQIPFKFKGQYEIGCTVFIFNIFLFMFNVAMITARFRMYPHTFRASFMHPTESLFIPAAVVSIGTILMNITEFGTDSGRTGVWLSQTMTILFWVYGGFALCFTSGIYLVMWSTQTFTISQMTPVWIFPAYPLLVIGPHAGMLSSRATASNSLDIIIGGFAFQGIGFMVATMVYAAFLYRLMTNKLPKESLRPGMFISVGPSGFTVAGVINMGQNLRRVIPADFMGVQGELAATISMVAANWLGIWLWGLAIFFFMVSAGANTTGVASGRMVFAMNWYSFVFPNTGLIAATFAVAKALNKNHPINVFGCVLTGLLVLVWLFVFSMMLRAVVLKQILWPQKQEDRDEGGFVMQAVEDQHRARHPDELHGHAATATNAATTVTAKTTAGGASLAADAGKSDELAGNGIGDVEKGRGSGFEVGNEKGAPRPERKLHRMGSTRAAGVVDSDADAQATTEKW